jgi:hypothetical protein
MEREKQIIRRFILQAIRLQDAVVDFEEEDTEFQRMWHGATQKELKEILEKLREWVE